jgi:hypothetical protein
MPVAGPHGIPDPPPRALSPSTRSRLVLAAGGYTSLVRVAGAGEHARSRQRNGRAVGKLRHIQLENRFPPMDCWWD